MSKKAPKVTIPQGDPLNGKKVFESQCGVCHSTSPGDDKTSAAPNLSKIVGRKISSTAFPYSMAFKKSKIIWTVENLFIYIKNPGKFMPGTRMSYGGLADDQDRADLIEFLKTI